MDINDIERIIVLERGMRKIARESLIELYRAFGVDEKTFRRLMKQLGYSEASIGLLM